MRLMLTRHQLERWRADDAASGGRVAEILARAVQVSRRRWAVDLTPEEARVVRDSASYWAWSYEAVMSCKAQKYAAVMRSIATDLSEDLAEGRA